MSSGLFLAAGIAAGIGLIAALFCLVLWKQPPKQGTESLGDIAGGCFHYAVACGAFLIAAILGVVGLIAKLYGG